MYELEVSQVSRELYYLNIGVFTASCLATGRIINLTLMYMYIEELLVAEYYKIYIIPLF